MALRAVSPWIALGLVIARVGWAEPVDVVVTAPCATSAAVADRLRREGVTPGGPVAIEIVATGSRARATVRVAGAVPRAIDGRSCQEVLDAAVVVIALAVEGREGAITG